MPIRLALACCALLTDGPHRRSRVARSSRAPQRGAGLRAPTAAAILLSTLQIGGCALRWHERELRVPPGGLDPKRVPQFVVFGSDDNGYSGLPGSGGEGGLHYMTELFAARRNPDGTPLHFSFYVSTKYLTPQGVEDPAMVKRAWQEAIEHGHELGVHTHSHPHGAQFTADMWEKEIHACIDRLVGPDGPGIAREALLGFRTPFLEYNDHALTAARNTGLAYDCSVEEGFRHDEHAGNFVWPYRLDHGSPGNAATYKELELPRVGHHPGLWEIPPYAFVVPPDDQCTAYGVPPGLRSKMKQKNDYFEIADGKITGFDWNLWFEFDMTKAEFLATLKYTLDQHLSGNRSPMTIGVHSDIYADKSDENPANASVQERREALREILDYVISKPEVRVRSARELLAWLRSPVPLRTDRPGS
jgi:hypothetical protein